MLTGRGQAIDVSTVECLASHLVQALPYYNYMGAIKGRRPVRGSGFEELMPARDGYVIPSVQGSQPWSTVAELIGVPELQDERFASGSGRIEFGEEIHELLLQGLAQWDRKALHQASGERRLVFGMAQDARRPSRLSPPGRARVLPHGDPSRGRRGQISRHGAAPVRRQLSGAASCAVAGAAQRGNLRRRTWLHRPANWPGYRRWGRYDYARNALYPSKASEWWTSAGCSPCPTAERTWPTWAQKSSRWTPTTTSLWTPPRTLNGPYPDNNPGENYWERGGTFQTLNRGKISVTLDLRSDDALAVLRELVSISDVVLENFTPRVMRRFGLDYPNLKAVRPDLIMVSNTGYGHSGPWTNFGAMATALEPTHGTGAFMGYLDVDAEGRTSPGTVPNKIANSYTDFLASWTAQLAVMASLIHRAKTGQGMWIDLAMYQVGVSFLGEGILDYAFKRPPRPSPGATATSRCRLTAATPAVATTSGPSSPCATIPTGGLSVTPSLCPNSRTTRVSPIP